MIYFYKNINKTNTFVKYVSDNNFRIFLKMAKSQNIILYKAICQIKKK